MLENGFDPLFSVALPHIALITVTLNPPDLKQIYLNNQAELACVITGQDKAIVDKTQITWQINNQNLTKNLVEETKSEGSQHSKTSKATIPGNEWQEITKVRCSATTDNMPPVIQELTSQKGGMLLSDGHGPGAR